MSSLGKIWMSAEAYQVQCCDCHNLTNPQKNIDAEKVFKTSEIAQDWVGAKVLDLCFLAHWTSNIQ